MAEPTPNSRACNEDPDQKERKAGVELFLYGDER